MFLGAVFEAMLEIGYLEAKSSPFVLSRTLPFLFIAHPTYYT
jgi:hypothetical protein